MKLPGKHVLVLGLGESGLAMARWCLRNKARVRIADTRTTPPALPHLVRLIEQGADAQFIAGGFTKSLLNGIDLVALSPGLSPGQMLIFEARARGMPVLGEIELFSQALNDLGIRHQTCIIAITGTNGKTTTTALTAHLCQTAGRDTECGGNISPAALDRLMARIDSGKMPEIWVLELSSFQLETLETLNANASTVLNISDDHLDRYINLSEYASAKSRIFFGNGAQILNRSDSYSRHMAQTGRTLISFGQDAPGTPNDFGLCERDGKTWLVQGDNNLLAVSQLPLSGMHNAANTLAALALCHAIGLPMTRLVDSLTSFQGLPHRVEKVSQLDGITFFDDSKGTNVGATIAALEGHLAGKEGKIILIAGGDGKGQDFSPLRHPVKTSARSVVLIGKDADLIASSLAKTDIPLLYAHDMDEAVRLAIEAACPGDAVLLSPACASFDMYRNYIERADAFIAAIHAAEKERGEK